MKKKQKKSMGGGNSYLTPSCKSVCICPKSRMMDDVIVTSDGEQEDYNYKNFWGSHSVSFS